MKLAQIAFRNIRRNTRRSLLSVTAIAVATMSIFILFCLILGMSDNLAANLQNFFTGQIRIRNTEYDKFQHLNPLHLNIPNTAELTEKIMGLPEVSAVSPRIDFPVMIYQQSENKRAYGVAVDFPKEKQFQDISSLLIGGSLPQMGKHEAAVGMALQSELGLHIGDKITILSNTQHRGTNAITLKITGILNFPVGSMNATHFLAPLDVIQYFLRMDDSTTDILVKVKDSSSINRTAAEINGILTRIGAANIRALSWKDIPTSFSFMEMAMAMYYFIAVFFFLLGSTVVVTTTMMVIYERMKEIGTIAALGMTGGEIIRLFFLESVFLAVIGALAGIIIGFAVTVPLHIFGINFGSALEGVSIEVSNIVYPRISVPMTLLIFVYSVTVASITSIIPSRRAAKIEPVQALRTI